MFVVIVKDAQDLIPNLWMFPYMVNIVARLRVLRKKVTPDYLDGPQFKHK